MITITQIGKDPNYRILRLVGKSSDEKPIKFFQNQVITNGSILFEIDTGYVYIYDAEVDLWVKKKNGNNSEEIIEFEIATNEEVKDVIDEIFIE